MARSTASKQRPSPADRLGEGRDLGAAGAEAGLPPAADAGIAPVVVRAVLAEARRAGIAVEPLCRGLGFAPGDVDAPGCTVSVAESLAVVRRALQATGNPALGLQVGRQAQASALGALALGLMASRTLGDALALALRHPASAGLLAPVKELRTDDVHVLQLPRLPGDGRGADGADGAVEAFVVDHFFAAVVALARQGSGRPFAPKAVEFARERPADAAPYEDWFGCRVEFGSADNRLVADTRLLAAPLPGADPMTQRLASRLLHEQAARAAGSGVVRATMRLLSQNLLEPLSPQQIAKALHMSERTLRRRLTDGDTSYRELLDELRKLRALDLVRQGELALSRVASETGFTDGSNFRRAFVRWTGRTPSAMRRGAASTAGG